MRIRSPSTHGLEYFLTMQCSPLNMMKYFRAFSISEPWASGLNFEDAAEISDYLEVVFEAMRASKCQKSKAKLDQIEPDIQLAWRMNEGYKVNI